MYLSFVFRILFFFFLKRYIFNEGREMILRVRLYVFELFFMFIKEYLIKDYMMSFLKMYIFRFWDFKVELC